MVRVLRLVACVLIVAAICQPGRAQELQFFRIGTATTGGTYFPVGSILANAISSPPGSPGCDYGGPCGIPGLIAIAQATAGAVENLRLLRAGELEAALAQASLAYAAYAGSSFYNGDTPFAGLRVVAALYREALHLIVREESDIRSVEDLRGRAVSLGETGSGTHVEALRLLAVHGLTAQDLRAQTLKPGASADALVEGRLDALFVLGGPPFVAISDLAERRPVRLIPPSPGAADRLRAEYGFYMNLVVPAETYPNVPEAETLGVAALLLVTDRLDEAFVYALTKAIWHPNNRPLFDANPTVSHGFSLQTALEGISVPLHPGARRFYEQQGLAVPPSETRKTSSNDGTSAAGVTPASLRMSVRDEG